MSTSRFTYTNEIPTIESAIFQGMSWASTCWDNLVGAGVFDSTQAKEAGEATLAEIRSILAAELTTLIDVEHVAYDWNAAIERAIALVEGRL